MKNSKFLNLNWYDFLKGMAVAIFTAVVTGVLQMLTVVPPIIDAKSIGITAITAMLGYLLKQLTTNSNGEVFSAESEDYFVIQSKAEPTKYLSSINEYNELTFTYDITLAQQFSTIEEAQTIINRFLEPANWFGARPPRPHKPQ